ncbi:MAG: MmcQ/YjbR family DNA-binding protein [Muribaculaceae bacterium]|nr:MmcQ/YjbR family DNA-binding protein [Muribaculaceae bacterium]
MNVEEFRNYSLSLPAAEENAPWTEPRYQYLITFTVGGKWFALLDIENKFCDLKCAPENVEELQARYNGVQPAWHMNKTHWIKLLLDSDVPDNEIETLIREAYDLIVKSLPKSKREELGL